jgi:hypothetical protein
VARLDFHPAVCFLSVRSERALLSGPGKGALQASILLSEFRDFCSWCVLFVVGSYPDHILESPYQKTFCGSIYSLVMIF